MGTEGAIFDSPVNKSLSGNNRNDFYHNENDTMWVDVDLGFFSVEVSLGQASLVSAEAGQSSDNGSIYSCCHRVRSRASGLVEGTRRTSSF